ncbi:MAG: hypothetical protein AAF740_02795 [Bacteroidota bacterium]
MKSLLWLIFLGFPVYLQAQTEETPKRKTYLGFGLSVVQNQYQYTGVLEKNSPAYYTQGTWGGILTQEVSNRISIETGLINYRLDYTQQLSLPRQTVTDQVLQYGSTGHIEAWQIPLSLRVELFDLSEKVKFYGKGGYRLSFIPNFKNLNDNDTYFNFSNRPAQTLGENSESYLIGGEGNWQTNGTYSLLEAGGEAEVLLFKKMPLVFSVGYIAGLSDMFSTTRTYEFMDGETFEGTASTKGSFWNFGVSLRYPISELWN